MVVSTVCHTCHRHVSLHGRMVGCLGIYTINLILLYKSLIAGVRPSNLRDAAPFDVVQREVAELLKGRIVVGHAIENDLEVRGGCWGEWLQHMPAHMQQIEAIAAFHINIRGMQLTSLQERPLHVLPTYSHVSRLQSLASALHLLLSCRCCC